MPDLYQVDLLRERREQLGLPEPRPVDARALLRQGLILGSLAVGLMLGGLGWLSFRLWWLQRAADALEPVSQKYVALQGSLEKAQGALKGLEQSNQALVEQILAVPATSALLQELANVIPAGLQVQDFSEKDNGIVIKGIAVDPLAFSRINAMALKLSASPLFDGSSVQLTKAARTQGQGQSENPTQTQSSRPQSVSQPPLPSQAPTPPSAPALSSTQGSSSLQGVEFELRVALSKQPPQKLLPALVALGSRGMALRVNQLRQEGLLP